MDLFEIEFNAKDVDAATRGLVNSGVLRSWVSRGYFEGPLQFPRQQGKAAKYGIVEIYFMAIAGELRQVGVPMVEAVMLGMVWVVSFTKRERPQYIFWCPGNDSVADGENYRLVSGQDYPHFDPFETLGEVVVGVNVLPVIRRVDRILGERHGINEETAA